jgi:P27 family predicted phage terminase small subunit
MSKANPSMGPVLLSLPPRPEGAPRIEPDEPDWRNIYSDESDIETAHTLWRQVVEDMQEVNTLSLLNGSTIRRLVEFHVQYDRAAKRIAEEGPIVMARRGRNVKQSLYWSVMRQASEEITRLEAELGVTPVRRARAAKVMKYKGKLRPADEYLTKRRP